MTELTVVGGGPGGCFAALAAARAEPSAAVRLLAVEPGRFERESGTLDLLGYRPDGSGPVEAPLTAIRKLPRGHPYVRLGTDSVVSALDLFADTLGEGGTHAYTGARRDTNGLVATQTGGMRPATAYPRSIAAGLVSEPRPLHLVGFEEVTHLDAELVADRLDEVTPYEVTHSTVEFPMQPNDYPPVLEFARALDENREVGGRPLRETLAETVRPTLDLEPRVGFPAVLGLEESGAVRGDLSVRLQADVFELPLGEPSLHGLRLRNRLYAVLESEGVRVDRNVTVDGVETADGEITSLGLEAGDERVEATEYVLATGDLSTGGLCATRSTVTEPLFDCHVPAPEPRREWAASTYLGDHRFAKFGVEVTDDLRPVTADGRPEYDNLRAAGTIVGGWDYSAECSQSGVGLVTGYDAGRLAVRE